MGSGTFACTLLSLYTTRQRAVEIEGDLIEEREYRGTAWFIINVISVTFSLFSESYRRAPLRITVLSLAATGLSVISCDVSSWLFFSPGAIAPVPLLGFIAIFTWAFLREAGSALQMNRGEGNARTIHNRPRIGQRPTRSAPESHRHHAPAR